MYIVLDDDGTKARKVRIKKDGSVLCSHCLKVLREIMKIKELPSQYILKRWTKKTRVGNVKDSCGHDIKVDVRLHQTSHYRSLIIIFEALACSYEAQIPP